MKKLVIRLACLVDNKLSDGQELFNQFRKAVGKVVTSKSLSADSFWLEAQLTEDVYNRDDPDLLTRIFYHNPKGEA